MHFQTVVVALAGMTAAADAAAHVSGSSGASPLARRALSRRQNNGGLALNRNLVQTGSAQNGNNPPAAGQSASATSNNNFINFCQGSTLTNGRQVLAGSCNGIPMGKIPPTNRMISTVILNPKNGDNVRANTAFNVQIQVKDLAAGSFTNAATTYYAAPQNLNGAQQIIGHSHVTIQDTGNSLNPTQPLDPTQFVFFKGINDPGNGRGLLSAAVTSGLPAGNYRLCTMNSASNHQPVLMPVAQRGAQDDCVRFTVGGNGNNNNNNNNGNNNNNNNGNNNNNAGNNGNNRNGNNGNNRGGNNNNNNRGGQNNNNRGGQNNNNNRGGQNNNNNRGGQNNNNNGRNGQNGQNGRLRVAA